MTEYQVVTSEWNTKDGRVIQRFLVNAAGITLNDAPPDVLTFVDGAGAVIAAFNGWDHMWIMPADKETWVAVELEDASPEMVKVLDAALAAPSEPDPRKG